MVDSNIIYNSYYSWWKNIDKFLLFLILSLFFLGLFFSLVSTSLIASDKLNTNSYYFFVKHLIITLLAFTILIIFSFFEKNRLLNICLILFIIFFISLVLVPFIGVEVKGSKRWIDPNILPQFQPIELLKPFFIVLIASILSINTKKKIYFNYFLSALIVIPIILLLISQPDIGQTFLIVMTWLSLIFISGVNLIIFFSFFILISSVLSYLVFFIEKFKLG